MTNDPTPQVVTGIALSNGPAATRKESIARNGKHGENSRILMSTVAVGWDSL